jgi:hypothetical protein
MQSVSKIGMISVAIAAMTAGGGLARAGFTDTHELVIQGTTSGSANGTLRDVRASADPVATIGCMSYATPSTGSSLVFCWARDSANGTRTCIAGGDGSEQLQTAVAGIDDDSLLEFAWNASARCEQIGVNHASSSGN